MSVSLYSKYDELNDDEVIRKVKRRRKTGDIDEQEAQIEKLTGLNKAIDKKIASLKKEKKRHEQEIKAIKTVIKERQEASIDQQTAYKARITATSLLSEIKKYEDYINSARFVRDGLDIHDCDALLRNVSGPDRQPFDEALSQYIKDNYNFLPRPRIIPSLNKPSDAPSANRSSPASSMNTTE